MSAATEVLAAVAHGLKQLTPVVCLGVAIACSFLLWGPADLLQSLALAELREQHRMWLGLGLVFSLAFLVAHAAATAWHGARAGVHYLWQRHKARAGEEEKRRGADAAQANKRKVLEQLTPEEKGYLKPYIDQQLTTQRFLTDDGIAGTLMAKNVIFVSAKFGDMWTGFDHSLQPWAREMLTAEPQLLEGARGKPRKPKQVI